MAKVVCENCGTSYKYEVVKDMVTCPVCGEDLWNTEENDDVGHSSVQEEPEDNLMYFDNIVEYKDDPEFSYVTIYCGECKEFNSLNPDKFDKLVDKEYVILKPDVLLKCRGCGKEHKPRKILYKERERYVRPRCPACNSSMLKKISAGSKILAAATLGAFAYPHNSKTFECMNCGYRF